jgi:hypothetical protein
MSKIDEAMVDHLTAFPETIIEGVSGRLLFGVNVVKVY